MFPSSARCRWLVAPGRWAVRGRVERFVEPAALLLLRDGPRHGYELREAIVGLFGDDSADVGNLYRVLRQLELEGIVRSAWNSLAAGPARRTYALTGAGRRLLDQWADALRHTETAISTFLTSYDTAGADAPTSTSGARHG